MTATRINTPARQMARGLGWFSLALGAAELLAPGSIKSKTGLPGPKAVLQAYGVREIAAGLAILCSSRPVGMVWARVGGDLLDLATAAPALRANNPHRPAAEAAFAFLLLATATDIAVALQGDEMKVTRPVRSGVRLQTRPDDLPDGAAPANRLPSPPAVIPESGGTAFG
jgi:hypothetical protein